MFDFFLSVNLNISRVKVEKEEYCQVRWFEEMRTIVVELKSKFLCLIRIFPSFVYSFACCLVTFLRDKFHFITFVPWSKHSKFLFFFASKLSSHFILWKHIWNLIFAQKYYFSLFSSSLIHSFHWIFARIVIFLFHFLIVFLHKKELLLYSSNFFSMFSSSSLFSFFFFENANNIFLSAKTCFNSDI